MYIGNFLFLVLNLPLVGFFARIATLRPKVLMPIVSVICLVGVYSVRNSLYDITIMILLGIFGFFLRRWKFPIAALVIGLVLGPMMESSFRQTVMSFESNYWLILERPIVLGVEDSFRTEKYDLGMRPIFHHQQDRTQALILVCFLALTMWRTLQQWMKASGLGTAPRKLLGELRELRSLDVFLPTRDKTIRLRMVATPARELKVLLQRMKTLIPKKPKIIQNVVEKMA